MKTIKQNVVWLVVMMLVVAGCDKRGFNSLADEDSDRPAWAGGNPDANDHRNKNDDSGTKRGGDYGDLYKLYRDGDGVPQMIQIDDPVEWYVQPVDVDGSVLELDGEGELIEPELAIEVDFGRLNIVRSPSSVLDQAFEEALKVLEMPGAQITLDFCGRLTSEYIDLLTGEVVVKTIDSPRENMALYRYLMRYLFADLPDGGENRLAFLDSYGFDPLMLAASCFAAGSDKTGTIDIDEVVYINGFINCTGINPILNAHEYDFNHNQKWYFNFGNYDGMGSEFTYNRQATYENRYILFKVWDNVYYPDDDLNPHKYSIWRVMEGLVDGISRFTYAWGDVPDNQVSGFALACDDAVQVLDFIHGDSNIVYLPDHTDIP